MAEIQSILRRIPDEIEKRGESKELLIKNLQIRMEKLLFMDMYVFYAVSEDRVLPG